MITLITSLLVSFSNDELNRILQSDAIKEMALMNNSMSQSQISQSLVRPIRRNKHRVVGDESDSESDDYLRDDDESDEVELDRYEEPVQPPVVKTRKESRNKFAVNTVVVPKKQSSARIDNNNFVELPEMAPTLTLKQQSKKQRGTARYPARDQEF